MTAFGSDFLNSRCSTNECSTSHSDGDKVERRFSQAEVDKLIQARLAEEKARLQKRFEKDVETKLAEKDAALEELVEARLEERLKERELVTARETLAKEMGLSEKQIAVLEGSTPEELRASAEELFGTIRKSPPVIPTGSDPVGGGAPGVFTRSQLRDPAFFRQHRAEIMVAAREGRIVED